MRLGMLAFKQAMPPEHCLLVQTQFLKHADPLFFVDATLHSFLFRCSATASRRDARTLHCEPIDGSTGILRWGLVLETRLDVGTNSPLLPGRILPSDDLGQQAMVAVRKDRQRVKVPRDAGRQLRTFKLGCPCASFCRMCTKVSNGSIPCLTILGLLDTDPLRFPEEVRSIALCRKTHTRQFPPLWQTECSGYESWIAFPRHCPVRRWSICLGSRLESYECADYQLGLCRIFGRRSQTGGCILFCRRVPLHEFWTHLDFETPGWVWEL